MSRPKKLNKVELAVVAAYVVQSHGDSTFEDVEETIRKLHYTPADGVSLRDVLDALKNKNIVSQNNKLDENNQQIVHYSMKKICLANVPETAQVTKGLLPTLLADEGSEEIKAVFDGIEMGAPLPPEEGEEKPKEKKGKKSKGGKPKGAVYRDSHMYVAKFRLLERLYGGRMMCPTMKSLRDSSSYLPTLVGRSAPVIQDFFERAHDGAILIHGGCVRGWFSSQLPRVTPFSESLRAYCSFDSVKVYPKQGVRLTTLPVPPAKGSTRGSPPVTYETLMPGEILEVTIHAPTTGFLTPKQMENYLRYLGPHATRKLSPARGSESGAMELISFEDLGDVWKNIINEGVDVAPPVVEAPPEDEDEDESTAPVIDPEVVAELECSPIER